MKNDQAHAIPEAFSPDPEARWTVQRIADIANGCVEFTQHQMLIPPAGASPAADAIRFHESSHVTYTDPNAEGGVKERPAGFHGDLVKMLEEIRVDGLELQHQKIDVRARHDDTDPAPYLEQIAKSDVDPKLLCLFMLQFFTTGTTIRPAPDGCTPQQIWTKAYAQMCQVKGIGIGMDIVQVAKQMWDVATNDTDLAHTGTTRDRLAKKLLDMFDKEIEQPKMQLKPEMQQVYQEAKERAEQQEQQEQGKGARAWQPGTGHTVSPEERGDPQRVAGAVNVNHADGIGMMEVCDHTKPGLKTRLITTPMGSTDRGTVLHHIERWAVDMAVFRHRRPGGAVLLDCSGSMDWDWDQLRAAIHDLPSTTIARYTGLVGPDIVKQHGLTQRSDFNGRLCIMAKDGRVAPLVQETDWYDCNAVDYEALTWLSRQPGPRVWLSDGEVNSGFYEAKYGRDGLERLCAQIMRTGQIWRTQDVGEAIDYLRKGRNIVGKMP